MERRSLKKNIEIICERVKLINETLGTKFIAEYDNLYKTWIMYEVGEDGRLCDSDFGFASIGKTMSEMYAYTESFFALSRFLRHHKEKISEIKW